MAISIGSIMHPNKFFRKTTLEQMLAFAKTRSFGTLSVNSDLGPLVSHIPFLVDEKGTYLEAHLVKTNPIIEQLKTPLKAVMAVSGPDAYISPDWYEMNDQQVPTWNYIAVHIRGSLKPLDSSELPGILDRLSQSMEARLEPKPPWSIDKLEEHAFAKMQDQIAPIAMEIESIDGTWKLSQNKPDDVRLKVADQLESSILGSDVKQLAQAMRDSLKQQDS